ncbi:MAG: Gldg family protein [Hyphomicrobium sp.]|jgi:ABC-type uncharacterized transport system involved in gliding motility auxiliary subunit
MNTIIASFRARLAEVVRWATSSAARLGGKTLAWGGLALAGVILLSVNLISSITLRGIKADLTEDRLYTISAGTRTVLTAIDEPIKVRVYFSRKLGEAAPSYGRYFERIRAVLEQYRDISGGKLELEILDPEPFSDAEDRAVAAGLRGVRYNAEGEVGYFGLVANNATDNQEVISFFQPDRETFVEYDVTKLVHTLTNPKKRIVGLMTSLPIDGGKAPSMMANPQMPQEQPTPPWLIMDQIREFFEVQKIDQSVTEIPSGTDVLLIAQPTQLTPKAAYAIDQYALKGGKVLAFIDPLGEAAQFQLMQQTGQGRSELAKLLKAWGIGFDGSKVAADIAHARRVQFGGRSGGQGMVTEFVAWLGLDRTNIDERDVLSSGISTLNLASAGILTPVDGSTTTVTPILKTSSNAMEISSQKVGIGADPLSLLRSYQAGGKPLTLAARVSGDAKSAFPNGEPSEEKKDHEKKESNKDAATPGAEKMEAAKSEGTKPEVSKQTSAKHLASGRINAIVVADTDLLADQFWVEPRQMLGQDVVIPTANNASFVVGALENLTGSDALIALRGRGIKERPFTLIESIRRSSEKEFREKEQALTEKLKSLEQDLTKLQSSGAEGAAILSDAERQAVDKAKAEMLATRRELRNVKLALRQSIDRLDGWLKFANIALIPLAIAFGGASFAFWRKHKQAT